MVTLALSVMKINLNKKGWSTIPPISTIYLSP